MSSSETQWDVFISHASEDKVDVVRPLVAELLQRGLRVWYDEHELTIGDRLREKIDRGLSRSRFGIVVLSENFFSKHWPKEELEGLMSLEHDGRKAILPVWHGVGVHRVREFSPILAGRLAADTTHGVKEVARSLINAIDRAQRHPSQTEGEEVSVVVVQELLQSYEALPKVFDFNMGLHEDPIWITFTTTIEKDPFRFEAVMQRGIYALTKEYYSEAALDFERASGLDVEIADPHYGLGMIYYRMALFDLALRERYEVLEEGGAEKNSERKRIQIDHPDFTIYPDHRTEMILRDALGQFTRGKNLRDLWMRDRSGRRRQAFDLNQVDRDLSNVRSLLGLQPPVQGAPQIELGMDFWAFIVMVNPDRAKDLKRYSLSIAKRLGLRGASGT